MLKQPGKTSPHHAKGHAKLQNTEQYSYVLDLLGEVLPYTTKDLKIHLISSSLLNPWWSSEQYCLLAKVRPTEIMQVIQSFPRGNGNKYN